MNSTLFAKDHANSYDQRIEHLVPGYRLCQELTLAVLRNLVGPQARLLIAGAGTGEEVLLLAKHEPDWSFVAVEPSANMAGILKRKLETENVAHRVSIQQCTVDACQMQTMADAAIAHLVTHFVQGDTAKALFFHSVAQRINPGAPLLHFDYVPDRKTLSADYRAWASYAGQSRDQIDAMSGLIDRLWDPANEHRLAKLLRNAGFEHTRSYFQALDYTGFVSLKER